MELEIPVLHRLLAFVFHAERLGRKALLFIKGDIRPSLSDDNVRGDGKASIWDFFRQLSGLPNGLYHPVSGSVNWSSKF
jgi:hypothetical protein